MWIIGFILIALAYAFLGETAGLYVTAAVIALAFLNALLNRRAAEREKKRGL